MTDYIDIKSGILPIPNISCLIKVTIDIDKKNKILKKPVFLSSKNPEQNEIEMIGYYSIETHGWVVDFKINPEFQKITHWKY